jgi:hypothetical protein
MSLPLSRRAFTAGSVVTILGGATVVSLPAVRTVVAQAGTDLTSLGLPTIDITVTADAFEGAPTEVEAGRYLLTVTVADDVEFGSAGFVSPPEGTSAEDFLMLLGSGGGEVEPVPSPIAEASPVAEGGEEEGPLPTFIYQSRFAGGTVAPAGMSGQAVIDLGPGEWILWGDDPEAPQPPVVFTVTGEMPTDLPEPDADIDVTYIDFGISFEGALTAGEHVLRIENMGAQPHFMFVAKGPDTMTNEQIADLLAWEMEGAAGTPPDVGFDPDTDLMDVGYSGTQSIGTVTWITLSLEPGTFLAACFFPTAGEGIPHAYHGMHTVFTVE